MVPALFTTTSGTPMTPDTASYSESAPSGWLRSAAKLRDSWPRERILSLLSCAGRRLPWHATDAPASASAIAMAAPSPVADPVTRASFPSRRNLSRIPIVCPPVLYARTSRRSFFLFQKELVNDWATKLLPVECCGIPRLAKNERDMGHPPLVVRRDSDLGLRLSL